MIYRKELKRRMKKQKDLNKLYLNIKNNKMNQKNKQKIYITIKKNQQQN